MRARLVADVGGTNCRIGVWRGGGRGELVLHRVYASGEAPSLESILDRFMDECSPEVDEAALAVAGPVSAGESRATNLPWLVSADAIKRRFGWSRVEVLNDVEAAAWGLIDLPEDQVYSIRAGDPPIQGGNGCLIAPGTGLGEAGLFWNGTGHRPFATEGGHCDFAPVGELERCLVDRLEAAGQPVSWERVVSGPGLVEIFLLLADRAPCAPVTKLLEAVRLEGGAAVTRAALELEDPVARQAVELFLQLLGREAGNLALKTMARAGVWIGGGIVPELLPAIDDGAFERGFTDKAMMRPLLETIPVRVILDGLVALRGAAAFLDDRG